MGGGVSLRGLPVDEWPPSRHGDWAHAVIEAGRRWGIWVQDRTGAIPDGLARRVLLATLEERGTRRSTQANEAR